MSKDEVESLKHALKLERKFTEKVSEQAQDYKEALIRLRWRLDEARVNEDIRSGRIGECLSVISETLGKVYKEKE